MIRVFLALAMIGITVATSDVIDDDVLPPPEIEEFLNNLTVKKIGKMNGYQSGVAGTVYFALEAGIIIKDFEYNGDVTGKMH